MSEQPNIRSTHIDLLSMARFLVLPGAVELLEAFARIPPGPLRDSVIQHAEVIATTYTSAPVEQQMPDPLSMAAQHVVTPPPRPAKALPGPPKRKPQNREEAIVKLRLEGLNKRQITAETGATPVEVETFLRHARRAGVKFQKPAPVRAPETLRFETSLDAIGSSGQAIMARAALKYGHSLESWVEAKATLVAMRTALKPMDEISAAIKPRIPEKVLWGWVYSARRAGIDLPLQIADDAEVEPAVAQEAPQEAVQAPKRPAVVPARGKPVFTSLAELEKQPGGYKSFIAAAAARGMSPQALFDLRESIILHRWSGKGATEIYSLVGQDMDFIRNALANAKQKGVVFPPVTSDFDSLAYGKTHAAELRRHAGTGRQFGGHPPPEPKAPDPKKTWRTSVRRSSVRQDFPLRVEDASAGIIKSVKRESLKDGQTVEEYFATRRLAVDMIQAKKTKAEIVAALGITAKQVENWRYRARKAGHFDRKPIAAE